MAEVDRTQGATGPDNSAPGTTGPETTSTTSTAGAGQTAPTQTFSVDYAAEIAALKRENERYQANIRGWEQQSRKHLAENQTLKQQMDALTNQLRGIGQAITGGQATAAQSPRTAAEALQRFVAGDDEAVNSYFHGQQDAVRTTVNEQLMAALGVLQRQQLPLQMHPEIADPQNPIRQDILAAYDLVAADQNLRMIYPDDPAMQMPLAGADGQQRSYDIRLLDRAALLAKAKVAATAAIKEEQHRQSVGDAMGAHTGTSGRAAEVDPAELFTAIELQQFVDPAVMRALPKEAGRDVKSITKWLVEGMTPAEKARRTEQMKARKAAGAV